MNQPGPETFDRATLKSFLQRWVITTLAVLVAANVVKGIGYDSVAGLLVASLLLGVLNAVLRPVLIVLSLPLLIVTLGLFLIVINAGLLYIVGSLVKTFHVASFGAAMWGAIVISAVSLLANLVLGRQGARIRSQRHRRTPGPPRKPGDGEGPVIDV